MEVIAGGKSYPLATLKLVDVRDLGKAGVMSRLQRLGDLEGWEQTDTFADVVSTSIRRAGGSLTSSQLLEVCDPPELKALAEATTSILQASGFAGGNNSPNGESPGTNST